MNEPFKAKMTDDLISRQAAIDALERSKDKTAKGDIGGFYNTIIQNNIEKIEALPPIQPDRKKGKWIEYVNSHCECTFCHSKWSYFENMTEWFFFCPNCGAQMEE